MSANFGHGAEVIPLVCYKDKPVYSGFDNTFTSFNDGGACYEIEVDGGALPPLQIGPQPVFTGSSGQSVWTEQITWMAESIAEQAAIFGYEWIGETLFINNGNPTDLSGIDNIPGAPTEEIAAIYIDAGLSWRIFQITVCPGSPSPTAWRRTKSDNLVPAQRDLLITKPLPGPVREFQVCAYHDGKKSQEQFFLVEQPGRALRLLDPVANANEMPRCLVPCGAAAQIPPPSQPTTLFESQSVCDEGNQIGTEDDGTPIYQEFTAYWTFANGEIMGPFGTIPNPVTQANDDYEIQGRLVDCNTGEPVDTPTPDCPRTSYAGQVWRISDDTVQEATVDWWGTSTHPSGGNSAPHGNVSDIFTVAGDGRTLVHPNGAPTATFTQPTGDVRTSSGAFIAGVGASSSAQTSGEDQLRVSGYVILSAPALLFDTNPNTGERGGIWINRCCAGSLELLFEDTTDSVSGDTSIFGGVRVPAGIHYFEAVTSDLSAWQGFQLSASLDDGATIEPLPIYRTKPAYECVTLFRCEDTGICVTKDGALYEPQPDDLDCEPPACEPAPASAEALADAIVLKQRDVTPGAFTWINETNTVSLPVAPGTRGRLVSVEDFGTGLVRWSLDGSDPIGGDAAEFTTTGPYHAAYAIENVDLSLVRLNGSSAGSDFSVVWEAYN